jgi:hypothetical protein
MTMVAAAPAKVLLTEHDQEYIWVAVNILKALDKNPSATRSIDALTDVLRRAGWDFKDA